MNFKRWIGFISAVAMVSGCHNVERGDRVLSSELSEVSFRVLGMMKAKSGAT